MNVIVIVLNSTMNFKQELTDAGLVIAGVCPDNGLVEIVEVKDHPWFVASQFQSRIKISSK